MQRSPVRWSARLGWLAAAPLLLSAAAPDGSDEPPVTTLSKADWAELREARQRARHAIRRNEGGFVAPNPGQRWNTRFDGRGFTTRPDVGDWTWGLELVRYGFPGAEQTVSNRARMAPTGSRMTYEWDELVNEWYVNDERGLEHGFTVRRRPPAKNRTAAKRGVTPLTFTARVRGGLVPRVDGDGRGVRFVDDQGRAALTYSGLLAFDADGQDLPARLERCDAGLRFVVDDSDARYPVTIDPIAQITYLKSSNSQRGDTFGVSVAIWGDTVVVGATGEDSSATGVDGNQDDELLPNSGAAYVFVRDGGSWSQQAYLKASNTGEDDSFGTSVGIWGDTIVVGADGEDSDASGVNGDQQNDDLSSSGAAYVFVRNGTTWSQEAYLKASNTGFLDCFGGAVAVSGDTIVAGAHNESSDATGVNGSEQNDNSLFSGAAYVFVRDGSAWSQQAYLKPSNTDFFDLFGVSVAISDDTILVGAVGEDSTSDGINGDQGNLGDGVGATYVFVRNGTTWSQEAYLKASNSGNIDRFGGSVSVSANTAVVGATGEDGSATGANGLDDDLKPESGAAYVFVRSGSDWNQEAYLKASNTDSDDYFGGAVAVHGDLLVVGAPGEYGQETGVNGDDSNNGGLPGTGAGFVFLRRNGSWGQIAYIKALHNKAAKEFTGPYFAGRVSAFGDTVLSSALAEDSDATGIDGDPFNNDARNSGAAFLFEFDDVAYTTERNPVVSGCPNPDVLSSDAAPALGSTMTVTSNATTGHTTAVLFGYAGSLTFQLASLKGFGSVGPNLLCNVTDPGGELLNAAPMLAAGGSLAIAIPSDTAFVGYEACVQGVLIGGGLPLALTEALDHVLGN